MASQVFFEQYKQNKIGIIAAGPAGSGKTETFLYIGARLGYDFIVINCSDQIGYKQAAEYLEEAFTKGNSVIFDEFNRCSIETVEGILRLSQELQAIKYNFNLPLKENERNTTQTGQFNGHDITIKDSSMIIFSLNPGYAGRTEVPKEFYEFCARIELLIPQFKIILPATIAQQGFGKNIHQIEDVVPKVITVVKNLRERSSQQKWYDFGPRALTQINKITKIIYDSEKNENLEELFLFTLTMKYQSSLLQQDFPKFKKILISQFPNAQKFIQSYQKSKLDQPTFLEKVKNAFDEAQLPLPSDLFGDQLFSKASYIIEVQKILVGILFFGDQRKSDQLLNLSIKLAKQLSALDIVIHGPIDFDSQTYNQAYDYQGTIDNIIQQAVEDQPGKFHWILFKGAINSNKIERLNTALDANQVLFLNNGQRINIPNNVKFIFQTNNLDMASPAFISRIFIVLVE